MRRRLLWILSWTLAFFSCRSTAEKQRMTISDALNVYNAQRAAYEKACIPTPDYLTEPCWAARDLLADCLMRIEDATDAREIGDAGKQIEALQKPCGEVAKFAW